MRLTSYPTLKRKITQAHSSIRGAIKRKRTLDTEIIAIIMLLNVHISKCMCIMCNVYGIGTFVQSLKPKYYKPYHYLHFCRHMLLANLKIAVKSNRIFILIFLWLQFSNANITDEE